jgi:hypothetical protein
MIGASGLRSSCDRSARNSVFGETSLRHAVTQFLAHYHEERNHQGLDNRLIFPLEPATRSKGTVQRRQRLGGMLNYYYREAA